MNPRFSFTPLSLALAGLYASVAAHAADVSAPSNDTQPVVVEITAERLKNARIELSPKVGTTIYTIDKRMLDTMGQGDNTAFDQVLLRFPGVAEDSKGSGSLHIRDDHGNVQYRVNGVQLPEGISGFGQSIDTRSVDRIDFLTGALPAQYGLHTAGVVDIQTKEGQMQPGGRIGLLAGSHRTLQPSFELFGGSERYSYYLSGSYLRNDLGIENPTRQLHAIHDQTEQTKGFGNLSYYLNDGARIGLMFGSYDGKFQVPNNPDQPAVFALAGVADPATGLNKLPSAQLDENQREKNRFFVLSLQQKLGDIDYQLSAFRQYSEVHFLPDPQGDLVYKGVASDVRKVLSSSGMQLDLSDRLGARHTLRAGLSASRQAIQSAAAVSVFPVNDAGTQIANQAMLISDGWNKLGIIWSGYVQDEWKVSDALTINYGVRYDHTHVYEDEQQLSPRVNLSWRLDSRNAVHAGYSRYFTPPPTELVAQRSIALYDHTTNAPAVTDNGTVKAERTHYFDFGTSHQLTDNLNLTTGLYYKRIANLLDEGQFGQALILAPFDYESGYAKGAELGISYDDKRWGGFFNLSWQQAKGRNIVSGRSLFDPDRLAYIAQHDVFLDHDQTYTVSGGLHYHIDQSKIGLDVQYGSGLRRTDEGGAPNGAHLPAYTVFNLAYVKNWQTDWAGKFDTRISIDNLFDRIYQLRDGTGVGVGAPQFGTRRSVSMSISKEF